MVFYLLPPDIAKKDFQGHAGFQDSTPGIHGSGIAGYTGRTGYQGYDVPTKVGARYFFPDPEHDDVTDQPIPVAVGNKWDGGAPVYQERVYKAAKKVGKEQGLKPSQIEALKPREVA